MLPSCNRSKPTPIVDVWLSRTRGCAATKQGELVCWGGGAERPHVVGAAFDGGARAVCAALADDTPRCRGEDDAKRKAASVAGADVLLLAEGDAHTCALTSRELVCWGANDAGQLGDGTTNASRTPVIVHGIAGVAQIVAGARHTCVRHDNGTVSCWGANDSYQLADGTTTPRARPTPVFGLVGVTKLAAAGDSTCALLSDASVRCWGKNDMGQLGDGTTKTRNVPSPIKSWVAR